MVYDVIMSEGPIPPWDREEYNPPPPTVWICSCGHEEAAHVENPENGLWPCVATSECRCSNFEVWS